MVVIFPCELPQDKLITLELAYDQSLRKSSWASWVPTQPLGLKTLQVKLPGEQNMSCIHYKTVLVMASLCKSVVLYNYIRIRI